MLLYSRIHWYSLFIKGFYCPQQCGDAVCNAQNSSSGPHCSAEARRPLSVKSSLSVMGVAIVWYEEVFCEGTRRENVIESCVVCVGWSGSRMNKASSRSCSSWETPSLQTQPRRELCSRYPHLHNIYCQLQFWRELLHVGADHTDITNLLFFVLLSIEVWQKYISIWKYWYHYVILWPCLLNCELCARFKKHWMLSSFFHSAIICLETWFMWHNMKSINGWGAFILEVYML